MKKNITARTGQKQVKLLYGQRRGMIVSSTKRHVPLTRQALSIPTLKGGVFRTVLIKMLGFIKKTAKAPFRLAGAMIAWKPLATSNIFIKDMARALRNPRCPVCNIGVMTKTAGDDNLWVCSNENCTHNFVAQNMEEAQNIVRQATMENGIARYKVMQSEEKDELLKARRFQSRFFFTLAVLSFVGCLYMIATGSSLAVAVAWLAIMSAFVSNGLKESYRYWQIQTGTLFAERNTFKEWLRKGKWLV